ncbi:JAB domain-containing protein [Candidatus Manganitrophus noduliformans]|uniref:JAB domain-containing protein n=1 Tax=Candidatus Manganitrophus noduliformans TaxID=2606439 RepID=A0A7X6DN61_9BACT|nr:JAB domain-containing protein [Candidatus Manganitrophus noduliformans]NKE70202.1 JAB domain-containing protein [Candidatus Manganitrophus noduliformans]
MQWVRVKLVKEARPPWATRVRDREDVHAMLKRYYRFHDREEALVVCLDNKNVPTHIHSLSVGGISLCIIDPRVVFTVALLAGAAQIMFIHNHPSGDPTPSKEDQQISRRLREAGELMGMRLIDSLIVGGDRIESILHK